MEQSEIRVYVGKVKEQETLCGRKLLAYGLWDMFQKELPDIIDGVDELYQRLNDMIEKEENGKPYLKDFPNIHFNISHSGGYGACALSLIPCGLDIQKVQKIKNQRILKRVLSQKEIERVLHAKDTDREFCRFWTRKESFVKLTGEGITSSMNQIEEPKWFEEFVLDQDVFGCISATRPCKFVLCKCEEKNDIF